MKDITFSLKFLDFILAFINTYNPRCKFLDYIHAFIDKAFYGKLLDETEDPSKLQHQHSNSPDVSRYFSYNNT